MAILGHYGRRISLRVLFHAPASPSLGTGTRRRLSVIAFPVIGIRLFRPASPPRPLSGLPAVRAGVRGVSSSRLLESHARPSPSARGPAQSRERTAPGATPASRAATLRAQDRDFRGNGSSGLGWPTPTHRHGRSGSGRSGSDRFGRSGRVDRGGCPPRPPSDPGLHITRTRFLTYDFAAPRNRLWTTRGLGKP